MATGAAFRCRLPRCAPSTTRTRCGTIRGSSSCAARCGATTRCRPAPHSLLAGLGGLGIAAEVGAAAGGGCARGGAHAATTSNSWRAPRESWAALPEGGPEAVANIHPTPEMLAQGARPGDGVIGRVGWFTADAACPIGPGTWEACLAAAGTRLGGGSGGGAGRHRLCAVPPARPPRLRGACGRALLRQQRRARRASAAARGGGAGRGDRHRQPPRQRHAGHLLGGWRGADRFGPCRSGSVLSLVRRPCGGARRGCWRGTQHQSSAGPRQRRWCLAGRGRTRGGRRRADSAPRRWWCRSASTPARTSLWRP